LRERAAVLAGACPVGVRDLGDDLAALFDRVEDGAGVEMLAQGGFDADFYVVEVDEDGDVQTILVWQRVLLGMAVGWYSDVDVVGRILDVFEPHAARLGVNESDAQYFTHRAARIDLNRDVLAARKT